MILLKADTTKLLEELAKKPIYPEEDIPEGEVGMYMKGYDHAMRLLAQIVLRDKSNNW